MKKRASEHHIHLCTEVPKIQLKNYNVVRCNILGNNEHLLYIYRIESRTNTRTPDTEVMNFVHLAKDPYS